MEFVCFCGDKAKTFKYKNGEAIFMCGKSIDFGKLREVLKMKDSTEKDDALQQLELGCNMKMKQDEVDFLQNELDVDIERKLFPKCKHQLLARLGISTSDRNNGRLYFTCNVKTPDLPCNFFKWFDECDEQQQSTTSKRKLREEEEEEEEEEKQVKQSKPKKLLQKKKRRSKT